MFVHATEHGIRVFDARCPHKGTAIPQAALKGHELTCPGHGWVFDAQDGRCIKGGGTGLTQLPSKIEDEELFAFW
jgi:nitrite reductase/ring-hydroxylating ferredoxin subunit